MCPRLRGDITPCSGTSAFALSRIPGVLNVERKRWGQEAGRLLFKNTRTIIAAVFMSCDVSGSQCRAPRRAGAPTSDCCCQSGLPQICGR